MFFPVYVDAATLQFTLGDYADSADAGSALDTDSSTGRMPAGMSYLGISLENRNHKYVLPENGVGKKWVLEIIPAYVSHPDLIISARGQGIELLTEQDVSPGFLGFRYGNASIRFEFHQVDEEAEIVITHNAFQVAQYVTVDAIRLYVDNSGNQENK